MKKVVVVGAGASGLPSIKSCLEEGFQVVCYELTDAVGGVWNYKDVCEEGTVSVFDSVVININKEVMAYSDYPPPIDYPVYPRHFQWHKYLESYAEHFGLRKYIKFHHRVVRIEKADDYEITGKWKVDVCDIVNKGQISTEIFDLVMLCTGHHVYPRMPTFPGQSEFEGRVLHSKEYRRPEEFRGRNVAVVGFGNSAVDIANCVCTAAKQTYLSTRRKGWIIPRVMKGKQLSVNELYRRSFKFRYSLLPESWLLRKEEALCNQYFDHEWLGIKPSHSISAQRPVINDFLPMNMVTGNIILKSGIEEFKPNGLVFNGDNGVTPVDVVILGTGFKPLFPFLTGMENADDYIDTIYKFIIPAHLKHHTLAFIGLVDPNYSVQVISELQSRWTARVFSGKLQLPSKKEMLDDAKRVQEKIVKSTYPDFHQKSFLDAPPYLEDLASEIGVNPNLVQLLVTDFKLFRRVWFGAFTCYQYRIRGPNAWKGARDAILGSEKRDEHVLKKNRTKELRSLGGVLKYGIILLGVVAVWQCYNVCRGERFLFFDMDFSRYVH